MSLCPVIVASFTGFNSFSNNLDVAGKTLMREKYAPKSPIFGLKPRFFALKPLDLYSQKWLVLAVFGVIRLESIQKQYQK